MNPMDQWGTEANKVTVALVVCALLLAVMVAALIYLFVLQ